MRYALIAIYLMVGFGVGVGIDISLREKRNVLERAVICVIWPTLVAVNVYVLLNKEAHS